MSAPQELQAYIDRLQRRLRIAALSRGAAVVAGAALGATLLLVFIANAFAFSGGSITAARFALVCILLCATGFGLAMPLRQLTRRSAVALVEQKFPQFKQRLMTFADKDQADPFVELLAADTLDIARGVEPAAAATTGRLLAWFGTAAASLVALLWMIAAAPGFLGYGAHLLWTRSSRGAAPLYELQVTPGDATARRHADQVITALPGGMLSPQVSLYAHYASGSKWEQVSMQPRSGAPGYQFVFTALPENVEYYVEAGAKRSQHFTIRVVDQPTVQQIKVTYHYPGWTGLKDTVEERGGDLRALEGTKADLEVVTDRPLKDGLLALDDGRRIQLAGGENNRYRGAIQIDKDGAYHVAALDQGQPVRLSEDFFIQARQATAPTVAITRPGTDYRASPIEEVTLAVHASDEFGLKSVDLHYSVNGGPEQKVPLRTRAGDKDATGSTMLALEDFKLVPGDVVSLYATASDARSEGHTDMAFIQVDPFEREFSQSQQAGGGGGGGGGGGNQFDPSQISQREKEIISQTFKQQNDAKAAAKQAAESAKFLSDVQTALRNQSLSLAGRLEARELTRENGEFSTFQQEMNAAAESMGPAASKLQQQKWQDSIPDEQKALQHLLRAEATFRQIEVAFGARGGGGGGGGGGAGRDLASLFDLELDTQKNQYETQQSASSADQRAQDIDDALQKLDALARRQEALAQQQRNNSAQSFEQRWQQEMLQREAEQLQRQIEQLTKSQQQGGQQGQQGQQAASGGAQGGSGQSSASGQAQSGQGGQSGSQQSAADARQRAAQQALDRLKQAQEDMRRATEGQSAADARLAAERLREATSLLGGVQSQEAAQRLAAIAREADRLAAQEKEQADRLAKLRQGSTDRAQLPQLATDRQRLADDLTNLEQNMRNAARELNSAQPSASEKLRNALEGADQSDLETRLQRTADWLRTGTDPNSNGTEAQVASGLQRLRDQTRDAQQALNAGGQQQGGDRAEAALNQIEQLRRQLEALRDQSAGQRGQGQPGQGQNQASSSYQAGALSRDGQPGQPGQAGQQGGQGAQSGQGGQRGGDGRGGQAGNIQPGGGFGGGGGYQYGFDTGNNARPGSPTAAPPQATPNADPQQMIQQGVNELNHLRSQVSNDPALDRQIQQLITDMEHLDLRRFPGNPAMVEELHQRLLSGVDTLELQLRRQLDDKSSGQVRSSDPLIAPTGYEDAAAEYFRRLSSVTGSGREK
ncbi:MAG: hypothetical protein DMF88_26800 [Acidobacteria bacterium]|nr:MAG: hypothetical protein DMF88_26800 [Acidobacteriota bacterium]